MNRRNFVIIALLGALTFGTIGCSVAGTVHMFFEAQDMVKLTIHDLEIHRRWDSWGTGFPSSYDIALRVYMRNTHIGTIPGERNTMAVAPRMPKYINRTLRFSPGSYQHPPDIRVEVWDYSTGPHYSGRLVETVFIPYRAWRQGYSTGKYIDLHYSVEVEQH